MAFALSPLQSETLPYRRMAAAIGISLGLHLLAAFTIGPLSRSNSGAPPADVMTVMLAPADAAKQSMSVDAGAKRAMVDARPQGSALDPAAEVHDARAALAPPSVTPRYYPVSEVDVPAQVMNDVLLRYPPDAYAQGIEGEVTLRIYISDAGLIDEIEIENAEPRGIFEHAALEAAWQLRYSPALKDGRTVKNVRTIAILFDPSDSPL
ncbi:MAG: energy transducer TonB [Burkholderiales bacterium]